MNDSETGSTDGGGASVNPTSSQPTVLVTGSVGRQSSSVALRLLETRIDPADGCVIVASGSPPDRAIQRLTAEPLGLNRDALVVVDCRTGAAPEAPGVGQVWQVQPDGPSLAVDRAVRSGLDWLADRGVERRHFLFDSLGVGSRFPDPGVVYELAYELAMTVGAEDGMGAFVVEPAGLSTTDVRRLGHLFDVRVELEQGETGLELRWTGLLGGSGGWLPIRQVDFETADFR